MLRRGIIASSGNRVACLFPLEGLTGPSFRPLVVDNLRQEVGAVYPMVDPDFPVWFAATPDNAWYSTAEQGWDGWRVLQMAINRIDSGIARLALTDSTFESSIDIIFDAASGSWTGLVDGVEQESTTGLWSEIVTFRVNGSTGDAVAMVGDTVLAEQPGMFNAVEFGGLISWNGENSISGDEFAAAVYSSKYGALLDNLKEGDADWCGNVLSIFALEESADNQAIGTVSNIPFLQRHAEVLLIDGVEEEAAVNQSMAPAADTPFLQRHVEIGLVDANEEEAAVNQSMAPGSDVTFLQRHQEIS
jgi:hypothetical protein